MTAGGRSKVFRSLFSSPVIRYLAAGGTSFIVDFGLLALLHVVLSVPLWAATAVAFLISFFVAYSLQRVFAFSATNPHGRALFRYTLLVAFNTLATIGIVAVVSKTPLSWEGGKVAATAITTVWNYFLYKHWVFRRAGETLEVSEASSQVIDK